MATYLEDIVGVHRARAAADQRDPAALEREAVVVPPALGFERRLAAHDGLAVIAEIKRRSPSRGPLAPGLDPAALATNYRAGGAACLSVLTDGPHFGGSADDLRQARGSGLPVLRKDFTVCRNDVCDARIMGADAVLLIVAALEPAELASLFALAHRVGLDALVEVHDEEELEAALAIGATCVGVNQRDLTTFAVDPRRAARLVDRIPPGAVAVAESGIGGGDDARRLAEVGYDAVLVGELLVTAADPRAELGGLVGHPIGRRIGVGR